MEIIKRFFESANTPNFIEKQIEMVRGANNNLETILYVRPILSATDLYSVVLPYLVLQDENMFNTVVTGLDRMNPTLPDITVKLTSPLLIVSDYVVFPSTTQNLQPIYDHIRSNFPNVRIIYRAADFNPYTYEKLFHNRAEEFKNKTNLANFEINAKGADALWVTNPALRMKLGHLNRNTVVYPLVMHPEFVLGKEKPKIPNKEGAPRIGIICGVNEFANLNAYKKELAEIGEFADLFIIGNNGKYKDKDALQGVKHTAVKPTNIMNFYALLNSLNLDLIFIPLADNQFNQTGLTYIRFMEAALFNIPVCVSRKFPPYDKLLNDEIAFLFTFKSDAVGLIKSISKANCVLKGAAANKFMRDNLCFNSNLAALKSLFQFERKPQVVDIANQEFQH